VILKGWAGAAAAGAAWRRGETARAGAFRVVLRAAFFGAAFRVVLRVGFFAGILTS
jgi:hypothetical protein